VEEQPAAAIGRIRALLDKPGDHAATQLEGLSMSASDAHGLIAIDKMGGKVIFLDPVSYAATLVLDDFERVPHELLVLPQAAKAYVRPCGSTACRSRPRSPVTARTDKPC
jgi:hypothetical protein